MTLGSTAWSDVVLQVRVLLQAEIDPNVVQPGWIPLAITVLLLLALLFLFFSMRKQIRKIQVPRDDVPDESDDPAPPESR